MLGAEELSPWYIELVRQGGLALAIVILSIIIYYMYKLYKEEKANHKESREKYTQHLAQLADQHANAIAKIHEEHKQHEDTKIIEHIERFDRVIDEKNERIAKLEEQNDAAERRYSEGLAKFLVEMIENRNAFTRTLDEHRREMQRLLEEALK